jgi:VWFA-related protein
MRYLSRRAFLWTCPNLLLGAIRINAEQAATFSAEVRVVNILATVRYKDGQVIEDLTKDDFSVFENGRRQIIRYFSAKNELPLTIALLVDTSLSQQRVLGAEARTVAQFMKHVLRAGTDQSTIVRFDHEIRVFQNMSATVDADALIDNVVDPEMRAGAGTHLYGAVYTICREDLASIRGRKVMIVLSDGFDFGSAANIADAEGMAVKSDVIYMIRFFDPAGYSGYLGNTDGSPVLKSMGESTGGAYFEPSKRRTMAEILGLLSEELHGQYYLGYVPDEPVQKSEFRKLTVTVNRPSLVVQARKWYFAQPP